jgi:hypothetical protein
MLRALAGLFSIKFISEGDGRVSADQLTGKVNTAQCYWRCVTLLTNDITARKKKFLIYLGLSRSQTCFRTGRKEGNLAIRLRLPLAKPSSLNFLTFDS